MEEETTLPELSEGQSFEHPTAKVTEHFTTPPKPHSEATLLSAVEHAGNGDTDPDAESHLYINSEEYQTSKATVNPKLVAFRSGLNAAQQKEFNLLMDMMNNAHAEFASKAFIYGTVNGITLREQVLRM